MVTRKVPVRDGLQPSATTAHRGAKIVMLLLIW